MAVIGGGNSGVEAAIDLANIVGHVTLIEFDASLRADQVLQDKLRSLPNVDIRMSAQTTEITGDAQSGWSGLVYKNRVSGQEQRIELEGVFVQIGLVPNTEWLKDSGLALSKFGEIEIDHKAATNLPGVFAAGDCTTVPYKQIVIADGRRLEGGVERVRLHYSECTSGGCRGGGPGRGRFSTGYSAPSPPCRRCAPRTAAMSLACGPAASQSRTLARIAPAPAAVGGLDRARLAGDQEDEACAQGLGLLAEGDVEPVVRLVEGVAVQVEA